MPRQIAIWNPARDVWESEPESLFCGHLAVYSETFPTSGTTRGGTAFALPTWAQHTTDSASSSSRSVPTPTSADANASGGSAPSDVTLTDLTVRMNFGARENPRHA